jgi:hypothetical protein
MPRITAEKPPKRLERLVKAKLLKQRDLTPKNVQVLRRLSDAEVNTLISMRRKLGGGRLLRGCMCLPL